MLTCLAHIVLGFINFLEKIGLYKPSISEKKQDRAIEEYARKSSDVVLQMHHEATSAFNEVIKAPLFFDVPLTFPNKLVSCGKDLADYARRSRKEEVRIFQNSEEGKKLIQRQKEKEIFKVLQKD